MADLTGRLEYRLTWTGNEGSRGWGGSVTPTGGVAGPFTMGEARQWVWEMTEAFDAFQVTKVESRPISVWYPDSVGWFPPGCTERDSGGTRCNRTDPHGPDGHRISGKVSSDG